MLQNTGALAAAAWLNERELAPPPPRWYVEIALDVRDRPASFRLDDRKDTLFRIDIYAEEWGFFFCHAGRASWIRVTDIAFVHGTDDFGLLRETPRLEQLGELLRELEGRHGLAFRRDLAAVRSDLPNADVAIRRWIATL